MTSTADGPFEAVLNYPDSGAARTLAQLVGLDEVRDRMLKHAELLLNPKRLETWSTTHHGKRIALVESLQDRSPLFIFAGDVGTGKTALAEAIGDVLARASRVPVSLFRLSLNVRGSGAVGQMTKLLSDAFAAVRDRGAQAVDAAGNPQAAIILLIDEADALGQSRDLAQMHHEDRAGVNALIRGIDTLAANRIPVVVIMCTNRLDAIDPALQRRAADIFLFGRPNDEQRAEVLMKALSDVGFTEAQIRKLVAATGPQEGRPGFTYSDLRQHLLPGILLDAFPDRPVNFERALDIAKGMSPTPVLGGRQERDGSDR